MQSILMSLRIALLGLLAVWFATLAQSTDVIQHYPIYDGFEIEGNSLYWMVWTAGIFCVGIAGLMPLSIYWRPSCMAVQMAWWFNVSYHFTRVHPTTTGVGGYAFVGAVCAIVAYFNLRTGKA